MENTGKSVWRQSKPVPVAGREVARTAVSIVSLRLARYVASVNLLRCRLRGLFARQRLAMTEKMAQEMAEELHRAAACGLDRPLRAR